MDDKLIKERLCVIQRNPKFLTRLIQLLRHYAPSFFFYIQNNEEKSSKFQMVKCE